MSVQRRLRYGDWIRVGVVPISAVAPVVSSLRQVLLSEKGAESSITSRDGVPPTLRWYVSPGGGGLNLRDAW